MNHCPEHEQHTIDLELLKSKKPNGSIFKIAFWVMTFICSVVLVFMANSVIANDRIRANEDMRIETKTELLKDYMHTIDTKLQVTIASLQRIEEKIDRIR